MVQFQLISDIHLEFRKDFTIPKKCENIVSAGDIGYLNSVKISQQFKKCICYIRKL